MWLSAHVETTNFLLAFLSQMFILGKNCGALAKGNLAGAIPL